MDEKDIPMFECGPRGVCTQCPHREECTQYLALSVTRRQVALLQGINRVLEETLHCDTARAVGEACLAVAEELTTSSFGFIGELNEDGRLDTIALSEQVWEICGMPRDQALVRLLNMDLRGLWSIALHEQRSVIINHPASHPERVGTPEGHVPIVSLLCVPLRRSGKLLGMIAVANNPSGYTQEDQNSLETLAVSFVEALERKRSELRLIESEQRLRDTAAALELANQGLKESNHFAEAANRAKSEFLANMSHEIRTPMTAILGYTNILLGSTKNPQHLEALHIVQRNSDHLLTIINDILDLSKIEVGKLEVERIACTPLEVLTEVVSLMRVQAAEKKLLLKLEFDGPCPEKILTDHTRLRQILFNLVGNAIKFTEIGEVRIVLRLLARNTPQPKMCFKIVDTGVGMAADQLEKLFQPFQQADASTTRKFGGTGLGLAISKRLAKLLGGDITVSSEPGKGSTFTVTVDTGPLAGVPLIEHPTEAVGDAVTAKVESGPPARLTCHVLLAEDGPDNQRLISLLLTKAGAQVTVAENGKKAMELALATFPGWGRRHDDRAESFDVILMDMQMPVMDGYEATRRLRAEGYSWPIIALTAHAMEEDMRKCLDAGCDAYLSKPIQRDKFLATIAEYATRKQLESGLVR